MIPSCIAGVGLNVNEIDFEALPQATSMRLASGRKFNMDKVFNLVAETLFARFENIESTNFHKVKKEYEDALFRKEMVSVFERPSGIRFNGVIKGVMDTGALLIENEQEEVEQFQLKEIKLLY
ncbi:MAG TPA: hypothetical protein DEG69_12890 [Flavobacteriaceae bacterium]|nr:hypothetical protein [Flavobacteriaceae bacterium]